MPNQTETSHEVYWSITTGPTLVWKHFLVACPTGESAYTALKPYSLSHVFSFDEPYSLLTARSRIRGEAKQRAKQLGNPPFPYATPTRFGFNFTTRILLLSEFFDYL